MALEGRSKTKVIIKGYITERTLELLSIKEDGSKVDCIHFGNTYYGTEQTQCAVLYNNGPEPISFVAVLDENALAEESVSSLYKVFCRVQNNILLHKMYSF